MIQSRSRGEMGDDKSSLRVASFSYCIDTAKHNNMLHKFSSAQEIPINVLASAKSQHPPPRNPSLNSNLSNTNKNTLTDLRVDSFPYPNDHSGEIGVFGANNYFRLDYQTGLKRDLRNLETTPAAGAGARSNSSRSHASSDNSRIALLPINLGPQAKQKKGIINARRMFLGFGCQGPCFDKKGVHHLVAEEAYIARSERTDHENNLEESRNSIEVFGAAAAAVKGEIAKNMERKLSMLTWDAIPKAQSTAPSGVVDDDDDDDENGVGSDGSSDLFEIENISGAENPIDDAAICISPASHYAPSEASIQWSVVTASALDCSAASDYNDDMSVSVAGDVGNRSNNKEAQKGRHGGILGCRSQKSVDVVQNVTGKNQNRAKHQPTLKK